MNGSDLISDRIAANPARLTRADMDVVAAEYKKKNRNFDILTWLGLWGGLFMGFLLTFLRPYLGLIDDYNPVLFLGSVATGLATAGAAAFFRRRTLTELQLRCAHCNTPLPGPGEWKTVATLAEHVAATGVCPSCGNAFFATEGRAAHSETRGSINAPR